MSMCKMTFNIYAPLNYGYTAPYTTVITCYCLSDCIVYNVHFHQTKCIDIVKCKG